MDNPKKVLPLNSKPSHFDLKFLLVGDPGSGKTYFCGTYTKGPVHFYMLDAGGEKTLYKLNKNRHESCPITVDLFSKDPKRPDIECRYTSMWKQLQQDGRSGFFDYMKEKNGLVVLPDSLTTANEFALAEVAKEQGRTLTSQEKPMRIQDWGQVSSWMKQLVGVIADLPCACASLAHLVSEKDSDGTVIARYPSMTGQFATQIGKHFDEIYLLDRIGKNYRVNFRGANMFNGASRAFTTPSALNITMDDLMIAYINGLDEIKSKA